jgi:hypothetical protein
VWHLEHRTCESKIYFDNFTETIFWDLLVSFSVIGPAFHHDRAAGGAWKIGNDSCAVCAVQRAPERRSTEVPGWL